MAWGEAEVNARLQRMATVLAGAALSPEAELQARMDSTEDGVMALLSLEEDVAKGSRSVHQVWDRQGRLLYRSANAPTARLDAQPGPGEAPRWIVQRSDPGQGMDRVLLVAEPLDTPLSAVLPLVWRV